MIWFTEFCEEETFELIEDKILITFPKTRAGYSNTTVETCPSKSNLPTSTTSIANVKNFAKTYKS